MANAKKSSWKETTIEDFLDLTPEDMAFIDFKISLCDLLKQTRTNKKMTQKAVAKMLGSSQSRVAKMESADSTVSLDLLITSLFALGKTPQDFCSA